MSLVNRSRYIRCKFKQNTEFESMTKIFSFVSERISHMGLEEASINDNIESKDSTYEEDHR